VHSKGILHRDIKPQNILLDKYKKPKIVDFGSAVHLKDPYKDSQKNSEGTRLFMAPEIVGKNVPLEGYSGKAADIWAMGVTFYALAFHCLPFYHESLLELYDQIETQP